jgi:conjugal transfer mating pair stabilization protein TraG
MRAMEDFVTGLTGNISKDVGISADALKSNVFSAVLGANGDLGMKFGGGKGGGKPALGDVMGAFVANLSARLQNNSQLSDGAKKGLLDSLSNMSKTGSGFSKDISKIASNGIENNFSDSDSYQKMAQRMQQHARLSLIKRVMHSVRQVGRLQLSMSSSLNIDGAKLSDTLSKPATAQSVGDWAQASGLSVKLQLANGRR